MLVLHALKCALQPSTTVSIALHLSVKGKALHIVPERCPLVSRNVCTQNVSSVFTLISKGDERLISTGNSNTWHHRQEDQELKKTSRATCDLISNEKEPIRC